jgi:hypothetical protein
MSRHSLTLVAAVILVLAPSAVGAQSAGQTIQVSVVRANVRDAASMNGKVIFHASQKDVFTVISSSGDWYFIETSHARRGYINRSVVQALELSELRTAAPANGPVSEDTTLQNADVIAMAKGGLGDAIIIEAIRMSRATQFDLGSTGLVDLAAAGVSPRVIRFMIGDDAGADDFAQSFRTDAPQTESIQESVSIAQPQREVLHTVPSALTAPTQRHLGLGGRVDPFTLGLGGSVRYWSGDRVGFQVAISRDAFGNSDESGTSVSLLRIAPAITYRFGDAPTTTEDLAYQPYFGAGIIISRVSVTSRNTIGRLRSTESESATGTRFQAFGGVELFFDEARRLGLSTDVGYYSIADPFVGIHVGGVAFSAAAHWYVR